MFLGQQETFSGGGALWSESPQREGCRVPLTGGSWLRAHSHVDGVCYARDTCDGGAQGGEGASQALCPPNRPAPGDPQAREQGRVGDGPPTATAAGGLGEDLTPTPILREQMGEAATVGAASFCLPRSGGCEKQGRKPVAEARPAVATSSCPPWPASLALPQASSQSTLPGARLGGLRAQWSEPGLKRPKSQLPAQLSLFLAV